MKAATKHSAAPELLDACRAALSFVEDELEQRKLSFLPDPTDDEEDYIDNAEAVLKLIQSAIQKAEGIA